MPSPRHVRRAPRLVLPALSAAEGHLPGGRGRIKVPEVGASGLGLGTRFNLYDSLLSATGVDVPFLSLSNRQSGFGRFDRHKRLWRLARFFLLSNRETRRERSVFIHIEP